MIDPRVFEGEVIPAISVCDRAVHVSVELAEGQDAGVVASWVVKVIVRFGHPLGGEMLSHPLLSAEGLIGHELGAESVVGLACLF